MSLDNAGMLQGWDRVSEPDVKCSKAFLDSYIKSGKIKPGKSIDCGGGIGRVSKEVLVNFFEAVDIVDQAANSIKKAKESITSPNMRNFYVSGLQDFVFEDKYDCIWIQWIFTHITDEDCIKFLIKSKANLAEGVSGRSFIGRV